MRFTVTPPGGVGLLIGQAAQRERALPRLGRTRTENGEVTGALTKDEKWIFVRTDRTWAVGYFPSETAVKDGLGSLEDCLAYVASGEAQNDLELLPDKETDD